MTWDLDFRYQDGRVQRSLYHHLVGSPPFKLREPLEEGGDPRADACNLPLYDTTCLVPSFAGHFVPMSGLILTKNLCIISSVRDADS